MYDVYCRNVYKGRGYIQIYISVVSEQPETPLNCCGVEV